MLHFLRSGRPSANVASSLVTAAKSTLNRQNARAVIVSALTATSATETVLAAGRQAMSIVGQTSGGTAAAVKVGVAEAVHRAATDLSAAAGSPAAVDGLHTLLSNLKLLLASLASEESLSPVVARFTVMVANAAARAVAAAARQAGRHSSCRAHIHANVEAQKAASGGLKQPLGVGTLLHCQRGSGGSAGGTSADIGSAVLGLLGAPIRLQNAGGRSPQLSRGGNVC